RGPVLVPQGLEGQPVVAKSIADEVVEQTKRPAKLKQQALGFWAKQVEVWETGLQVGQVILPQHLPAFRARRLGLPQRQPRGRESIQTVDDPPTHLQVACLQPRRDFAAKRA